MFTTRILTQGIGVVALLVIVVMTRVSAQPASPAQESIPGLLAEVRALRAELNQAAGASMRMQLLVARLTLQEQRIATLTRQIAEVQGELAAVTSERAEAQKRVGAFEAALAGETLSPDEEQVGKNQLRALTEALSLLMAREQQLRARETELLLAITAEQARWTDFNTRLDELEGALPPTGR